jgi:hypothetical protein
MACSRKREREVLKYAAGTTTACGKALSNVARSASSAATSRDTQHAEWL